MVYELWSSFGVIWSYGGDLEASRWFQLEISEELPVMMVTNWCALVL